jgi:hypothetical protein
MIAAMETRTQLPDWLQVIEKRLGEAEADLATVADGIALMEARARRLNEERLHLRALLAMAVEPEITASHKDTKNESPRGEGAELELTSELAHGSSNTPAPARAEPIASILEPRSTNSAQLWKVSVRELLLSGGQPLHYRTIHQELRRLGVTFGGQNPAASFLAVLNRDPDFSRVGRGTYWVKGSVPALAAEKPRAVVRRPRAKVRKRR